MNGQVIATKPLELLDVSGMEEQMPKTAKYLIDVIGLRATLMLAQEEGGNELRIPHVVGGASAAWAHLVSVIGAPAAGKMVEFFGGTSVYVPQCRAAIMNLRTRDIQRRYDAGEPLDSIRRTYRFSRSYMFRLLKKAV